MGGGGGGGGGGGNAPFRKTKLHFVHFVKKSPFLYLGEPVYIDSIFWILPILVIWVKRRLVGNINSLCML